MTDDVRQIADKNRIKRFVKIYKNMKEDPETEKEKLIQCEKGIRNLIDKYNKKYKQKN